MEVPPQVVPLKLAYKKAEDALHSLGIDGSGADIASVNELRYAGNHLLQALTASDQGSVDDQLQRALRHCERALYDAYDGAVYYRLTQFKLFREDYRKVVISNIIPDYITLVKTMNRAKATLETARTESEDRADYYMEVESQYPAIVDATETLEAAREELNKKVEEQRGEKRSKLVTVAIAVFSALVGAAAVYLRMRPPK